MKKNVLFILAASLFVMVVTGCSDKTSSTTSDETKTPESVLETENPISEKNFTESELILPVTDHEGWNLPGTLTLPNGDGPFPAVVLVHGSGPNDRDETIYDNKPFRDIAETLAENGIAVYRYDKRTYIYGQQISTDTDLTLIDETVTDAAAAVELLRGQPDIDPSRIFVLGHSLGGQALPEINRTLKDKGITAAGYIFFAAPARKLKDIMREQYDFLYSLNPILTDTQKTQKEEVYAQLDNLDNLDSLDAAQPVAGAYPAYWRYFETYNQVETAQEITSPCLMLQGEEDYQVTMEDFQLWKDAYGEKENWTFKSYPGLTHLFMAGEKSHASNDYLKKQTVNTEVLKDIQEFIRSH